MTKEELMSAITGLPVETQVYKIDDLQTLTARTAALCLAL